MADLLVNLRIRALDGATAVARKVRTALNGITKAQERAQKSFQLAGNINLAAQSVDKFGAAARRAILGPLSAFEDFEDQMLKVRALTGEMSDDTFNKMTGVVEKLGRTTKFTTIQAAQGMENLAKAGFTADQQIAALPTTLNLAQAAGSELGTTSDIVTNVLSGFRLGVGSLDRAADVLTTTFTGSNTTLESLGETMSFVAPTAAGLGVSLEEAAAFAGLLGSNAIKGSRAGTTLNAILTRLAAPRRLGRKAIASLGLDIADSQGNMRKVSAIFGDLVVKLKGMGNVKQSKFIARIFGQEASAGIKALLASMDTTQLSDFTTKIEMAGGATKETAKTMESGGGGASRALNSAYEGLVNTIGKALSPEFKDLKKSVTDVLNSITTWVKEHPNLTKQIMGTVAALAVLLTGLTAFLTVVATLVSIKGVAGLAAGLLKLIPTMGGAAAAAVPLNAQLAILVGSAGGIALIAVALGSVGLAIHQLVKHWEELDILEGIKGMLDSVEELGFLSTLAELLDPRGLIDDIFGTNFDKKGVGSGTTVQGEAADKGAGMLARPSVSGVLAIPDVVRGNASADISGGVDVNVKVDGPGRVSSVTQRGSVREVGIDNGLLTAGSGVLL